MLFQTHEFLCLVAVVLAGMVLLRTGRWQVLVLLAASYVFYMTWNPTFIVLLLGTTLTTYACGRAMARWPSRRSRVAWLAATCAFNLGVLAVYKYLDFFITSIHQIGRLAGHEPSLPLAGLALPVGISFFTFQAMSYIIDVFRGQQPAEKNVFKFALYVAFFPTLLAGPILRAPQFLPQLDRPIDFHGDQLRSGCNKFLVGLVKKILIADQVSPLVRAVFVSPQGLPSAAIWIGTVAFAVQIYCDFSAYSDMAIGTGRILGFDIPKNFNYPYASRSLTEFWRRWHIALSSWLRDYLYIPLGGNRSGRLGVYRNLLITMGLGGLWHGAGWNFLAWGLYHGTVLSLERALGLGGKKKGQASPIAGRSKPWMATAGKILSWLVTLYVILLGWLLFRVSGWHNMIYCVRKFVAFDFSFSLSAMGLGNANPFVSLSLLVLFLAVHAFSYRIGGIADRMDRLRGWRLWLVYLAAIFCLAAMWPTGRTAFIYFQF
ncbi:MAG: MBOAT family protein [Planctomycetota bacterium]|nr:MBOAT family protein [Planctomycetota bacterium]